LAATPAHIRPRASYCSYLAHRALHSLPTRRSSDLLEGLRFPVVTKPVDMYGSRGLYVLNSPQEVRRYFGKASSFSRQKKILVERSEEHTSELQSRFDLVCRLLLEKKKEQANHTLVV